MGTYQNYIKQDQEQEASIIVNWRNTSALGILNYLPVILSHGDLNKGSWSYLFSAKNVGTKPKEELRILMLE